MDAEQRRLARDPTAAPSELRRLFDENRTFSAAGKALAYNPSTPLDILAELVEQSPGAFCRNPIASLILLEMPDFAEKASPLGITRMLRSPRAPATLVHQLAEGTGFVDYLTQTARWHIQYRKPIPDGEWATTVRQLLREWLRSLPKNAKQNVVELAELGVIPQAMAEVVGEWPVPELEDYDAFRSRPALTPNQVAKFEQGFRNIPEEAFDYEGDEDDQYIYLGASFNPAISDEKLTHWRISVYHLAETLARNPRASGKALLRLSQHGDISIRRTVLRNPNCPPEALPLCRDTVLKRLLHETTDTYFQQANPYWKSRPPWAFGRIVCLLYASDPIRRPLFRRYATSPLWEDRLAAALAICDRPNGQPIKPKHRVMIEQLANDGNCLVRAAAQGRLRGETFSLAE